MKALTGPVRRLRNGGGKRWAESFWALDDVSFEIAKGELVGVIGRNGAGKTTLLRILSRITKPTRGLVELRGRVGSLLEVGTGFHPELTGRENIYLNGSIMGMARREIGRKFDEIVDFAQVERFLDTPVKRYSSGMYVRLAFAVAAHLEPEILLVDEVLAVGDVAFQRKCLGRMRDIGRGGRTVLFVSHNMAVIESLCQRAYLLDAGKIARVGPARDVTREYQRLMQESHATKPRTLAPADSCECGPVPKVFRAVTLLDASGAPTNCVPLGGPAHLRISLRTAEAIEYPSIGIGIDNSLDQRLLTVHTPLSGQVIERVSGRCDLDCRIPNFPLAPGDYWLKLAISARGVEMETVDRALFFTVTDGDAFGEGRGFKKGLCVARAEWAVSTARSFTLEKSCAQRSAG